MSRVGALLLAASLASCTPEPVVIDVASKGTITKADIQVALDERDRALKHLAIAIKDLQKRVGAIEAKKDVRANLIK